MDDQQRFTEIFRDSYAQVLAYTRRRVARDVANDVVAETFLDAWRRLDRIPDDPLPWLYRAAAYEIAQSRRTGARDDELRRKTDHDAIRWSEPDLADSVEWTDQWRRGFAALGEQDREILRLVAWEGLEPARAAEALGCSTVAFKVRLHRARRRLTHLVGAEGERPSVPTNGDGEPGSGIEPSGQVELALSPEIRSHLTTSAARRLDGDLPSSTTDFKEKQR